MKIDKDLVQKAVDDVVASLTEERENEEKDTDLIYSDEDEQIVDKTPESDENPESPTIENEEEVSEEEEVEEKVEDEVEEEIEKNPSFNFLGLDISVEKTENGQYNLKIVKDEKEKVEVIDSPDLTLILNTVEEFFNELVLEEPEENEEVNEEEIEEEEDESKKTVADLLEDYKENEDEDEDESEDNGMFSSLASLRNNYADDVEKIFQHGLLAKEIVLDMIKENLTAKTVKELSEKFKKRDQLIASKKQNLRNASINYLVAKKFESNLKQSVSILSTAIINLKKETDTGKVNSAVAKKAVEKYKAIIADLINAENSEAIIACTSKINSLDKAIVANVSKNKVKTESKNEKDVKFSKSKNVLNRTGRTDNKSLLSNKRYDSIDEMSAEILRIAGIEE